MKELNFVETELVSGGDWEGAFNGLVIGATTYGFMGGKWAMASGPTTFGIAQAIGTLLGVIVGGIGGTLYGAVHTSEEVENYFTNMAIHIG